MASLEYLDGLTASREGDSELVVQHTQERSGWVALPPALCSRLFEARGTALPLPLELRPVLRRSGMAWSSDTRCYAAWAGSTCAAGCLGIPASLARALGPAEGTSVAVRALPGVPDAVSVTVEPASEDDWEVVQLNAEYLEEQLLNQVGVASPLQPLPFYIRSLAVLLRVTGMVPAVPVARLVRGTEIYVAPRPRVQTAHVSAAGHALQPGGDGTVGNGRQTGNGQLQHQAEQQRQQLKQEEGKDAATAPLQTVLRVQQVSQEAALSFLASPSLSRAAASSQLETQEPQQQQKQQLPLGVQLVLAHPATLAGCGLRCYDWVRLAGRDCRSLVKFASLSPSERVAPGHLALTVEQCEWAGAPPFSHILLQRLTPSQRQLIWEAAELRPANGKFATAGSTGASLGGNDKAGSAGQRGTLGIGSQVQHQASEMSDSTATAVAAGGWLRQAAEAALRHLLPVLGYTPRTLLQSWGTPRPGGLLVCGPSGSGKSALLAAAAAALQRHPGCLTYTVTLSCRQVSAEGASQAQAQILPKVHEALQHLPALLVLDDLDVLCPAEAAGADGAATSADPALLTWLCELLDHLATPSTQWGRLPVGAVLGAEAAGCSRQSGGVGGNAPALGPALWPPLAVAASCRDAATLAAPLRAAGRLDHIVTLPAPSAESRAAILASAAAARGAVLEPHQLQRVAEVADGFDAADLEVLLDRALHIALRRQLAAPQADDEASAAAAGSWEAQPGAATGGLQLAVGKTGTGAAVAGSKIDAMTGLSVSVCVQLSDLLSALEGFTPAAFWGTGSRKAVQAGVQGWQDVGGMDEARQALHEALELPAKYARLVAQAPLRLRTGVLLYGPPGCGKTHIVAAAVAATGVRCITVSGPELLNKYIGASEAAVRDVFQRAAAAAPCLLFFDEFDAIAPQRGHDNTGVSDRVVNQLLTELDGVEGLRGVCVVAATSRPDLLDAALLRPGRLDRLVFCGFPSPLERGAMLRALSRAVQLAPDIDLAQVGYNAEFFSCADLSALLAEAQLAAVHEALEAGDGSGSSDGSSSGQEGVPPTTHTSSSTASSSTSGSSSSGGSGVVIHRRHLEAALASARPSVPEAERDRLEAIYHSFRQGREPGGGSRPTGAEKGKMVSWA